MNKLSLQFLTERLAIAYGSVVVLKHTGTNGGYLHSHLQRYTTGSTRKSKEMLSEPRKIGQTSRSRAAGDTVSAR